VGQEPHRRRRLAARTGETAGHEDAAVALALRAQTLDAVADAEAARSRPERRLLPRGERVAAHGRVVEPHNPKGAAAGDGDVDVGGEAAILAGRRRHEE